MNLAFLVLLNTYHQGTLFVQASCLSSEVTVITPLPPAITPYASSCTYQEAYPDW
jgi:hypothetical protein